MNISDQILAISLMYAQSFIYLRVILYGIKRYVLNNSAYKKEKKAKISGNGLHTVVGEM